MDFINDILKTAISTGKTPWIFEYQGRQLKLYPTSTDFGEYEPEEYIAYDYYTTPVCFADDEEQATEYTLTLHVITVKADEGLYRSITKLLKSHDFIFQGSNGSLTESHPQYYQEILEFKFSLEMEE